MQNIWYCLENNFFPKHKNNVIECYAIYKSYTISAFIVTQLCNIFSENR